MNFKSATFYSFSRTLWNHYATPQINISLEEMCNSGDLIHLLLLFFGFVIVSCCSVDFFPVPAGCSVSWQQLHTRTSFSLINSAAIKDGSFLHLLPDGWKPYAGMLWLLFPRSKFFCVLFFLSCSLVLPLFLSSSSAPVCSQPASFRYSCLTCVIFV